MENNIVKDKLDYLLTAIVTFAIFSAEFSYTIYETVNTYNELTKDNLDCVITGFVFSMIAFGITCISIYKYFTFQETEIANN